jgi:predicted acetyltransferase
MKPTSVEKLAAVLAVIRPAKRYLLDKSWEEVMKEVWIKPDGDEYYFKKAHAHAYALAIVLQLNMMVKENHPS